MPDIDLAVAPDPHRARGAAAAEGAPLAGRSGPEHRHRRREGICALSPPILPLLKRHTATNPGFAGVFGIFQSATNRICGVCEILALPLFSRVCGGVAL